MLLSLLIIQILMLLLRQHPKCYFLFLLTKSYSDLQAPKFGARWSKNLMWSKTIYHGLKMLQLKLHLTVHLTFPKYKAVIHQLGCAVVFFLKPWHKIHFYPQIKKKKIKWPFKTFLIVIIGSLQNIWKTPACPLLPHTPSLSNVVITSESVGLAALIPLEVRPLQLCTAEVMKEFFLILGPNRLFTRWS